MHCADYQQKGISALPSSCVCTNCCQEFLFEMQTTVNYCVDCSLLYDIARCCMILHSLTSLQVLYVQLFSQDIPELYKQSQTLMQYCVLHVCLLRLSGSLQVEYGCACCLFCVVCSLYNVVAMCYFYFLLLIQAGDFLQVVLSLCCRFVLQLPLLYHRM